MASAVFDAAGARYAVAGADGRVRVFDVAQQRLLGVFSEQTGQSAAPAGAPEPVTCLLWVTAAPHKNCLLLGCASGAICLLDPSREALIWRARPSLPGGAASLAPSDRSLFAAGARGDCVALDLSTGAELSRWASGQSRLAVLRPTGEGSLLLGGQALTKHDASAGAVLSRWTGHSSEISSLEALPAPWNLALSAALDDRTAVVWDLERQAHKDAPRRPAAAAQLPLSHDATGVSLCAREAGGKRASSHGASSSSGAYAAVCDASGAVSVFLLSAASAAVPGKKTPRTWSVQKLAVVRAPQGAALLSARVAQGGPAGATLVVALGHASAPSFQSVQVSLPAEGDRPSEHALAPPRGELVVEGGRSKHAPSFEVAAAGAEHLSAHAAALPALRKRALENGAGSASEASDSDVSDAEGEGARPDASASFADRLRALALASPAAMSAGEAGEELAPSLVRRPRADSLGVLLTQALRAQDGALLERCLSVRGPRVLAATLRALPPPEALALLRALHARLAAAPRRARGVADWVRALLVQHAGFLAASPAAQPLLAALAQVVDARVASRAALAVLGGKLDLALGALGERGGGVEGVLEAGATVVRVRSDGSAVALDAEEDEDEEGSDWEDEESSDGGEGSGDSDPDALSDEDEELEGADLDARIQKLMANGRGGKGAAQADESFSEEE